MNYREFIFVLSCLDWKEIKYCVYSNDAGSLYIASSMNDIIKQKEEYTPFDSSKYKIDITDIKLENEKEESKIDLLLNKEEPLESIDLNNRPDNLKTLLSIMTTRLNISIDFVSDEGEHCKFAYGNHPKTLIDNHTGNPIAYNEQYVISSFTKNRSLNIGAYIGRTIAGDKYYYIPIGTGRVNTKTGTRYNSYARYFDTKEACCQEAFNRIIEYARLLGQLRDTLETNQKKI